jgi:zinc transporter 1/2/3
MPGAIMLASVFFVTLIEMIFSPAQHVCGGNEGVAAVSRPNAEPEDETSEPRSPPAALKRTYSESSMAVRDLGTLRGRVGSISRTLSRYREDGQRLDAINSVAGSEPETPDTQSKHEVDNSAIERRDSESGEHNQVLTPEQQHKKAIMQVFLLEMGILFHSIFIGMSLAVTVGNDFTVLLIAIVFHRKSHLPSPFLITTKFIRNIRRPRTRRSYRRHQMETPRRTTVAHGPRIRLYHTWWHGNRHSHPHALLPRL